MAVHPNSVIDTQIDSFDSDLYDRITTMETYCYDNSTQTGSDGLQADEDDYQPFFQDLNDAIVNWLNTNRNFPWDDYWQAFYAYVVHYKLYGDNPSLFDQLHADDIFDMDGYITRIKGDPDDFYDDFYMEDTTGDGEGDTPRAPNLENDTSLIQGSYTSPEKNDLDSLKDQCTSSVQSSTTKHMFQTVEVQGGPYTKKDMHDFIFGSGSEGLNYEYWLNLFGQSGDVPEHD